MLLLLVVLFINFSHHRKRFLLSLGLHTLLVLLDALHLLLHGLCGTLGLLHWFGRLGMGCLLLLLGALDGAQHRFQVLGDLLLEFLDLLLSVLLTVAGFLLVVLVRTGSVIFWCGLYRFLFYCV